MRVKTLARILGIGIVALAVAGVAMLMALDVSQYRGVIERQAEAATGRALSIAGPMDLSISLQPAVVLEDVSFANAAWGSRQHMVTAERIEAQVDLIPLLSGEIKVTRLVLVRPTVTLEVDKDGRGNWVLDLPETPAPAEGAPAAGGTPALPDLRLVRVEDATFAYIDQGSGETRTLSLAALEATATGWAAPLAVEGSGRLDDLAFTLAGTLGPLSTLLDAATPYPVVVRLETDGGASLGIDGRIAEVAKGRGIDLALNLSVPDPEALAEAARLPLPASLPGLRLDGRVSDRDGGWRIDNLAATLGDTSLAGALAVRLDGPRPAVSGTLTSPLIDLPALLPAGAEAADAPAGGDAGAGRLFPDDPLPLGALKAADAGLDLAVTRLVLPNGLALEDVAGKVALKDGRLAVAPLSARVGGGTARVSLALNAADGAAADVSVQARTEDVVLGQLLTALGQGDLIQEGPVDLSADLTGRGGSVAALMGSLDGDLTVTVGQGTINNGAVRSWTQDIALRLIDSLNPFAAKEQYTVMQCVVVRLGVAGGVARSDRGIALETPQFHVTGSGTIDLGQETVDMAVRTGVRQGAGIATADLANLIRVQGRLADPQIGIDPLGAARTAISTGAAIASGGLSLLAEQVIDRTSADPAPCATALGKAPPADTAAPAATAAPAPAQALPETPAEAIKDLGETLNQGLKGLFGSQ